MTQVVSPRGRARWPKLNEPDRKFNQKGEFVVDLVLEGEEAEEFKQRIDVLFDKGYADILKREGKKKLKQGNRPYRPVEDQNGEETGETAFKFKMKALVETRDGRSWEQRPDLFDARGKPMSEVIGGGSIIRCSAEAYPWYSPTLGMGLSLRLKGVQVLDLKAPLSGGDAKSHGFDDEEGFETSEDFAAQFAGDSDTEGASEDF
jgi:hypothetical protein